MHGLHLGTELQRVGFRGLVFSTELGELRVLSADAGGQLRASRTPLKRAVASSRGLTCFT